MPKAIDDEMRREVLEDKARYGGGQNMQFWSVPTSDGTRYRFRVLPGTYGRSQSKWYVASAQHWVNKTPYECPAKSKNEECPFCTAVDGFRREENELKNRLKKATDPEKQAKLERQIKKVGKMIKGVVARPRFLLNVLVHGENKVPRVFRATKMVFDSILNEWDSADEDLFDLSSGHDFKIAKTKEKTRTTYTISTVLGATAVGDDDDEIKKILDKRANLESLVTYSSEKELEKACAEALVAINDELEDEDSTEAEKPKQKAKVDLDDEDEAPKKKKAPVDEDDEPPVKKKVVSDDEDEALKKKKPPVDEDDEDPAPKPKKKAPVDEDEDEAPKKKATPPQDDDEDEAPKKKKAPVDEDDEAADKTKKLGSKLKALVDLDDDDE